MFANAAQASANIAETTVGRDARLMQTRRPHYA